MSFLALAQKRKSIRRFLDKPVPQKLVDTILEAARLAPSAGNLQAYEVVTVKNEETRKALAAASFGQAQVSDAPVVMVFVADPPRSAAKYGDRGAELYSVQDASIACAYAQLAAADLGLGAVWVGAFDEDAVAKAVNASGRPVALLPIGYPAEKPGHPPRRDGVFFEETLD
ncbi:MAG: nitroreductase family protein [Candidatus Diapherotrites archaeon]|nr:nitroreductase family protein [Candidatus Diapherotrites archaeon]